MKSDSDEDIVKKIQSGQINLFSHIVDRYQAPLSRYLKRLLNCSQSDIQDLLQETFLKSFQNIQSFDTQRKFSSWIYRIAHNQAVDFMKRSSLLKFVSLPDLDLFEKKQILPEETAENEDLKKELLDGLSLLDSKYKEVLQLYYFEDQTYEEISDILHIPVNHVGVLMYRAKKKLKEKINDHRK
jgi:RNA polymerase sigma-70 factor, ECF subfamily